jgi:hypothetical protein
VCARCGFCHVGCLFESHVPVYINVDSLYHWSCVSVYLKTQVVGGVCIYFCTMMLFDVFHYAMYVA